MLALTIVYHIAFRGRSYCGWTQTVIPGCIASGLPTESARTKNVFQIVFTGGAAGQVTNSPRGTIDDFVDARIDRRIAASRYQLDARADAQIIEFILAQVEARPVMPNFL